MVEKCRFCESEFEHTVIREYENWVLQLHMNQYYLGRCLIKLKRHAIDVIELEAGEREELFEEILPELKNAADNLFSPDLYNYSSLGNSVRHLHFHFIPRYSSKREFDNQVFLDENWNSHYKPYPKGFEIENKTFEKLKSSIASEID